MALTCGKDLREPRGGGRVDGPISSYEDEGTGKMNLKIKILRKFCGGVML
jgi:hypothetical protein